MGKIHYVFDKKNFNFRKVHVTVGQVLLTAFKWLLVTLSLAVFYYAIFALFFSTDEQKRLIRENQIYEEEYERMAAQNKMNADVIKSLQLRDKQIYEQIFHATPPSIDPANSLDYRFDTDSIDSRNMIEYGSKKAQTLLADAAKVEANFQQVFQVLGEHPSKLPPMGAPLANLNFAQIGASVGQKINPFFKVSAYHSGLDLIVGQGTPVLAAADGVVSGIHYSRRGQGNTVEIDHGDGYVTRYAHLNDIKVRKGRVVKRGEPIAEVGMSGKSFAPHLHYEVLHDGQYEDPVNYLFYCLTPNDYANVLYMAIHTEQSLD